MRRSRNVSYIKKDDDKEKIYEAYIAAQNLLKMQRHINKVNQDKVSEVRKHKNEVYNKLKYQLLKCKKKIYVKDKHIFRLRGYITRERAKAKKQGIIEGKTRIKNNDSSMIKMYDFLTNLENVSDILGMKISHCGLLLWAGRYEFFSINDYKRDFTNPRYSFTYLTSAFKLNNFIVVIGKEGVKKRYALTGTGLDTYNKLNKFTKKYFNE